MTRNFRQRLAAGMIVGDGAWGTMLADRGLPAGAPPERWTLEHPEIISEIARAYVDAGAEIVTTNTFGGGPMPLAQHRLGDRLEEINRRGVEIVRDAVGQRAYVSASVGPTGQLLAPLGTADPEEVAEGFARQARVLVDAGADLICIETMTDLREATIAVHAVRSVSADVPIVATMTFEITPRGPFTMMGVSVPQAAAALASAGADVVGANCGAGIDEMLVVADAFRACTTVPIAIQANAGLPVVIRGKLVYPDTPDHFANGAATLTASGVRLIGGCCGTTPAHIRAIRARLTLECGGLPPP
jgi:5-methyltetrahydrofolate--homocysteine methyltransferase